MSRGRKEEKAARRNEGQDGSNEAGDERGAQGKSQSAPLRVRQAFARWLRSEVQTGRIAQRWANALQKGDEEGAQKAGQAFVRAYEERTRAKEGLSAALDSAGFIAPPEGEEAQAEGVTQDAQDALRVARTFH